ncbi:hypothetical protein A2W24_01580 [Microgenomates group bacterium RBG_16_45_19]|nr:MAG: hypothetical protein A2W24_01580 [Microgenomates group bacterium RBG_16_45_19]
MIVNQVGQTGNSVSGSENWSDYAYELDMVAVSGADKNIPFRYIKDTNSSLLDKFYEVHVSGNGVYLGKAYGVLNSPPTTTYNFQNNVTYRWRIELVGNKITVFIKTESDSDFTKLLEFVDNNSPYLSGSIGVRVGAGSVIPSGVYFDNIKVYDLSEPEPTPTPLPTVPYYSQHNPQWGGDQYDNLNRTISQVGCALSSAVMVLRYYGIDKLPFGANLVDLNPGSLNQWLNLPQNTDGWWRSGIVNWSALTRIARQLHDLDPGYPKLEYEVIAASNTSRIHDLLEVDHQPLIFRQRLASNTHFVVAHSQEAESPVRQYAINDPWDESKTLFNLPPEVLTRVGHYYPTNSDLSFLYLHADDALKIRLTDPADQTTGHAGSDLVEAIPLSTFDLEYPLANRLDETDSVADPFWSLSVKYPQAGAYILELTAPQPGWYHFEVYAYDQEGNFKLFKEEVYLPDTLPHLYTLTYFNQTAGDTNLTQPVTFASFKQLINALYRDRWLTWSAHNVFQVVINKIETMYRLSRTTGLLILSRQTSALDTLLAKKVITPQIHRLMSQQLTALYATLSAP